jgi:hypothetical protein
MLYVVAGVIGGSGTWLIVDGYRSERRRRRLRPSLTQRLLLPYHRGIADEAEAWLTQQG